MRKILCVLIALVLLLPFNLTLAEEEPAQSSEPIQDNEEQPEQPEQEQPVFSIDTQHVFEGMGKSYGEGYVPVVENENVKVILPLKLSEGAACEAITASLNLGDPSSSPFIYKNYIKDFSRATLIIEEQSISRYLVCFELDLSKERLNGNYPVTVDVKGTTEGGVAVTAQYTLYILINDGKNPNAPQPQAPKPISQPKLLIEAYQSNPSVVEAGTNCDIEVIIKNTSTSHSARNIKVSFQDASGEILPNETSSVYISKISKEEAKSCCFTLRVTEKAAVNAHMINVMMEYEYGNAVQATATDLIVLNVTQPIRLEYEQPTLPTKVTEGDNLPFSMNLMNLGKSTVYNALLKFQIPGLNNGGSVLVGNIAPGESKSGDTNLLVSSMNGKYGEALGKIILTYENESGKQFEKILDVQTTIEKKLEIIPASNENSTDKKADAFPWWYIAAGAAILIAGIALLVIKMIRSKKQREKDELLL